MINASGRPIVLAIDDASIVGEARRTAMAMAGRLGFDETERGKVAIVATEAATNLSKHAQGGELVIQGLECGSIGGVDILSLDRGPGMPDVHRCMTDGFSTAGSPGTGLGAMARLSTFFDIYTLPEHGTATLARLWSAPHLKHPRAFGLEFGSVSIPVDGEEVCGDAWAIEEVEGQFLLLVVDGLGHGPQAAEAAREALKVFEEKTSIDPVDIIQATHGSLRSTRGAALAVARIDPERGEVRFAGVGNISGSIHGPADARSLSMVSQNGIVGHTIRKIQEFSYPWAPGSLLVMHSDGLATQWQLGRYAGLASQLPGLIAGMLYRDFKRVRDDATVLETISKLGGGFQPMKPSIPQQTTCKLNQTQVIKRVLVVPDQDRPTFGEPGMSPLHYPPPRLVLFFPRVTAFSSPIRRMWGVWPFAAAASRPVGLS